MSAVNPDREMALRPTDESFDITVVIAVRNSAATIGQQLNAFTRQEWTGSWQVVVADNGSSDATVDIVQTFRDSIPQLRLLHATERPGAAYARNAAASATRGRDLLFCDGDDVVADGWLAAMGHALSDHPLVCGPLAFDLLNESWLQTAFYSTPPRQVERFEGIFPIAPSANLGVRREAFECVSGFDEAFLTGQDLDLCLRLWQLGLEMTWVPDAIVQYRYRSTMRSLWMRSLQYGQVAPAIVRRLRESEEPMPSRVKGLRNYLWLVRHLPDLRHRRGRAHWVVVAGNRVGRVLGSIKQRTLFL